ncbi:MAG TPA: tetratricopeptide repeat protein [Polyangiaceae bacterium]|nr:tetratricopeptide repeat protein [Polyangiaceae bacterium]
MSAERDSGDELLELAKHGFEMEAPVMAGDEARIERMVRMVERQRKPRRDERRWRYILQGAVAGVLLAGVAIGSIQLARPLWQTKPAEPPARVRVEPKSVASAQPVRRPSPVVEQPAEELQVAPPAPPLAVTSAAPRRASSAAATVTRAPEPAPSQSAAELFAAANRARVNGDIPGAIQLSRQLQNEYPRSTEATSSRLSLGLLYLQQGRSQAALEEFRLYRKLAPGGSQAEALWGEAQALRGLGRTDEERAVLEELLTRYPGSAFSGAAQKRLAALR